MNDLTIRLETEGGETPPHKLKSAVVYYNIPTKTRAFYDQNSICLPWQDFPEFRKVLVPLRKFAFLN